MQKLYSKKNDQRNDIMKLFGFAGTAHKPSYTAEIMEKLSDELKKEGIIDTAVIIEGSDVDVSMCKGCLSCYGCGKCVLDAQDDMEMIRNEMLSSDIVVLGSPVYVHDVSGAMKNFIDRFVVWMYLYKLVGKIAVTVSTSVSNGNRYVDEYLSKIMKIMGANVAGNISVSMVNSPEEISDQISQCCEAIKSAAVNGITEPDAIQEGYFSITRQTLTNPAARGYLADYWKEKDLAEYERYMDYYNSYSRNVIQEANKW